MLILSDGHLHALYKDAHGTAWHGSLIYMKAGAEHIPLKIGNERLMLEFVMPKHFTDATFQPKYIITGLNRHYLLRRNYREIRIHLVNEYGVMEPVREEHSFLSHPELAPIFVTLIQNAICYYASLTPETRQFIYEARGKNSLLMKNALSRISDELQNQFTIKIIDELTPPFFGFELDAIK
jgi:hypothetical protein